MTGIGTGKSSWKKKETNSNYEVQIGKLITIVAGIGQGEWDRRG